MAPWLRTVAVAVAMPPLLVGVSGPALAEPTDSPIMEESYLDNLRCQALTQQFDHTAAQRPVTDAAKKEASQGEVLCRFMHYEEGANILEKAVRMTGETPAKP